MFKVPVTVIKSRQDRERRVGKKEKRGRREETEKKSSTGLDRAGSPCVLGEGKRTQQMENCHLYLEGKGGGRESCNTTDGPPYENGA